MEKKERQYQDTFHFSLFYSILPFFFLFLFPEKKTWKEK